MAEEKRVASSKALARYPKRMHNGYRGEGGAAMATLTLKNVPEALVEQLKRKAKQRTWKH